MQYTIVTLLLLLLILPFSVSAHHSVSEYDESEVVEFEGEVRNVFWRNPHVTLHVTTLEGGEVTTWRLEAASVSSQRRRGVTEDIIRVGDKVRVAGFASVRRPGHMVVNHLLLPSGEELLLREVTVPRWSDTALGGPGARLIPESSTAAPAHGLFRVWSWGRAESGWWFFRDPEAYSLTPLAATGAAEFNETEDNPLLRCISPGMPAAMGNPYPMEFTEVGGNIEYRQEEFDVVRTIYLNSDVPDDVPSSALGRSVGYWDGETLVVTTTNIDWPYFNRAGVPQSDAVEVRERFTVQEEENRLYYELIVTDPETLTEPFRWTAYWIWRPGEQVNRYDCAIEDPAGSQ